MKLVVENLGFNYGEKSILSALNMHVKEGEFVSILGASGSGKSTILNLLSGSIQPEEGRIFVDGEEICGVTKKFAYMPQNDLLFPWKSILENVSLYGKINGSYAQIKKKALSYFPIFGLEGYEHAYPKQLSGGMRQRAAFLRTALCESEILLLDEPFGALDVITREDMQDWLLAMRKSLNRTILLVTHDIEEAMYLSDKIFIIEGRPATIVKEISLVKASPEREWLYEQRALRMQIYKWMKGET